MVISLLIEYFLFNHVFPSCYSPLQFVRCIHKNDYENWKENPQTYLGIIDLGYNVVFGNWRGSTLCEPHFVDYWERDKLCHCWRKYWHSRHKSVSTDHHVNVMHQTTNVYYASCHGILDNVVNKQTKDSSLNGRRGMVTQYLLPPGANPSGFVIWIRNREVKFLPQFYKEKHFVEAKHFEH